MNAFVRTSAAVLVGLIGTAAQAAINLPVNVTDAVRFDGGTTAFDVFGDPAFDASADDVRIGDSGLVGVGDLTNINNITGSIPLTTDRGSIDANTQLTWALAGRLNLFESLASKINAVPNTTSKKFNLTFTVSGINGNNAELALFERDLTAGAGFGAMNLVGKNSGAAPTDAATVLADVQANATPYLNFSLANATASIDVIFEKTAGSTTFNKRTITLQKLAAELFPIVGGSAQALYTGGLAVSLDNLGSIVTTVAPGSEVGDDGKWSQGNFALAIGRNIPEPASLAMVGLGALLIGARRRRVEA